MKRKEIMIIAISFLSGILLYLFIINPAITGYDIYKQVKDSDYSIEDYGKEIENIRKELLVSEANLSSCVFVKEKTIVDLEENTEELDACRSELNTLKIELSSSNYQYQQTVTHLKVDIDNKDKDVVNFCANYGRPQIFELGG